MSSVSETFFSSFNTFQFFLRLSKPARMMLGEVATISGTAMANAIGVEVGMPMINALHEKETSLVGSS